MTREPPHPARTQGAAVDSQGAVVVEVHRPTVLLWANAQNWLPVASPLEVLYISSLLQSKNSSTLSSPQALPGTPGLDHVVAGDSKSPVPAGFLTSAEAKAISRSLKLSQELHAVKHLPTSYEVDGIYLDANYMEMRAFVENMKQDWDRFGVTIMCDSWTGPTGMSIINFMIFVMGLCSFTRLSMQLVESRIQEIKKVVIDEIGHKPCAAHTVNLILKDIGKFHEVARVVKSAKRMSRFFYNHNRLHAEMRDKIGGELIRPNATRFGTVFIFLQSIHDKKDKFRQWMVSDEWKNSDWKTEEEFDYIEACLTSSEWWNDLKRVLDRVQPLYFVLRYADQQKDGTVSWF
ncbi:hypothetical protein D1007_11271 [Hordeum vulgare]|nr:hypothetical protein D1007_11271 [Hordeum vulgare]